MQVIRSPVSTRLRLVGSLQPQGYSPKSSCIRWRLRNGQGSSSVLFQSIERFSLRHSILFEAFIRPPKSFFPVLLSFPLSRVLHASSSINHRAFTMSDESDSPGTNVQVPLILAVVSLAGTIITTIVTAYITWFSEEHKARREANKILLKYRDPLLLSATDLQARCYGLCDLSVLDFKDKDVPGDDKYKDTLYIYTAYVVGQYLSWTWILRRQAQFMALVSSSAPNWHLFQKKTANNTSSLLQKIENVKAAFNVDEYPEEKPFLMFKAHQQILGEIMSCQDASGEYYCMGFATFTERWKNGHPENVNAHGEHKGATVDHDKDHAGERMAGVTKISDQTFRAHFKFIEQGIDHIYEKRLAWRARHPSDNWNQGSDGRLRRLQHLLLDLMDHLDSTGTMINQKESSPAIAAPHCKCSLSPCHCRRGCQTCIRNQRLFLARAKSVKHCSCDECEKEAQHLRTETWSSAIKNAANHLAHHGEHSVAGATSDPHEGATHVQHHEVDVKMEG